MDGSGEAGTGHLVIQAINDLCFTPVLNKLEASIIGIKS